MPKYKNVTDQKLVIPGVGTVEPGGVIDADAILNNPNLKQIDGNEPLQQAVHGVMPPSEAPGQLAPAQSKLEETA